MRIEEIAPWEPLPTDEESAQAKQTREQAIKLDEPELVVKAISDALAAARR